MKRWLLFGAYLLLIIVFNSNTGYSYVVIGLKLSGYELEKVQEAFGVTEPIYKVKHDSFLFRINAEEDIIINIFNDAAEAKLAEKELIERSPLIDWFRRPKLFRSGSLILFYMGNDLKLMERMEILLGKPTTNF